MEWQSRNILRLHREKKHFLKTMKVQNSAHIPKKQKK